MATKSDFNVFTGEDAVLSDTCYTDSTQITKLAITGFGLQMDIYRQFGGSSLLTKTSAAGQITITDGPNGLLTVTLARADLITLAAIANYFWYKIRRIDSGHWTELTYGTINLIPG